MGIINIVKTIKEIHKTAIIIIEIGSFCHIYDRDAYIISYLFNYQVKKMEDTNMCGFPNNSLNKVMAKLEEKKIDYLLLDRKNNYEIREKSSNGNLNQYETYYKKSNKYIKEKMKIDNLYQVLLDSIEKPEFKDIIKQIEEVLSEKGKISSN